MLHRPADVFSSKGEQSFQWQLQHLTLGQPRALLLARGADRAPTKCRAAKRAHSGPRGEGGLDPARLDFDPTPKEKCGQHTPVPPSGRQAMVRSRQGQGQPWAAPQGFAPAATAMPHTDVLGLLTATKD